MLVTRGLERVLGDLTSLGYDTRWTVMGAADVGANHQRDRIWIVGKVTNPSINGLSEQTNQLIVESQRRSEFQFKQPRNSNEMANTNGSYGKRNQFSQRIQPQHTHSDSPSKLADSQDEGYVRWLRSMGATQSQYNNRGSEIDGSGKWWKTEPDVGRVAHGVRHRTHRLKALGNAVVPQIPQLIGEAILNAPSP